MTRKAQPVRKLEHPPTQLRAWRKLRDLTLEKVSVRLKDECDVEMSHGQLSRVERGESPYSQNLLEGLAKLYRCEPADLISRRKPRIDALQ